MKGHPLDLVGWPYLFQVAPSVMTGSMSQSGKDLPNSLFGIANKKAPPIGGALPIG